MASHCIRGPKVSHFLLLSADHYLSSNREPGDLYCESYEQVAVLFATIPDFMQTFIDDSVGVGEECLKKLNLIISRFDKVSFWLVVLPNFKVTYFCYFDVVGHSVF